MVFCRDQCTYYFVRKAHGTPGCTAAGSFRILASRISAFQAHSQKSSVISHGPQPSGATRSHYNLKGMLQHLEIAVLVILMRFLVLINDNGKLLRIIVLLCVSAWPNLVVHYQNLEGRSAKNKKHDDFCICFFGILNFYFLNKRCLKI